MKALLELALDAVLIGFKAERFMTDADYALQDKAVLVLQDALAEQPAYRAVKTYHEGKPVYVADQPAQEPAAWYRDEDGIRMYYDTKYWADSTPLYTSPPAQRTWVGLTDEEIEKCFAESDGTFISAGRAIEAAHGIKENK